MLHYLPIPGGDELLYSVFARYAVHMGITSPKQCLDDLFGSRTVVANVDLPSQLGAFLGNIGHLWPISAPELIYRHTLFPLYAPFVPDERRRLAMTAMCGNGGGTVHARLGVAASRIKQPGALRYCPACLITQHSKHGEYHWQRLWQAAAVEVCPRHGGLIRSGIAYRPADRHHFLAATPANCPPASQSPIDAFTATELQFVRFVSELLELSERPSPTYGQWSRFYHFLAADSGCTRRSQIRPDGIVHLISEVWAGKTPSTSVNMATWITPMFRKHRKSFSYVQHLAAWAAMAPHLSAREILDQVHSAESLTRSLPARAKSVPKKSTINMYRDHWQRGLETSGAGGIRLLRERMGAVYSWLFRHDHDWLLVINRRFARSAHTQPDRGDWQRRDTALHDELLKLSMRDTATPRRRRSAAWYLAQLADHQSVQKNLSRLSLCRAFLVSPVSANGTDLRL